MKNCYGAACFTLSRSCPVPGPLLFSASDRRYLAMPWLCLAAALALSIPPICICHGESRWCRLIWHSAPVGTTAQAVRCRLAKEARAEPARFFRFSPALQTRRARPLQKSPRGMALWQRRMSQAERSPAHQDHRPGAFYVRLLNPDHPKFKLVESFFRDVVDPVVDEAGMRRIEMGPTKTNMPS